MMGLLFKDSMTLANLREVNPKSRTSRTRGLKRINENPGEWTYSGEIHPDMFSTFHKFINIKTNKSLWIKCPFGKVGDILYGKETYSVDKLWDDKKPSEIDHNAFVFYHADTSKKPLWVGRTRSAMMMPETASRYHIILDKIIAQRIQEISVEDIIKEGLSTTLREHDACCDLKKQWITLWDSINGKTYPWKMNVWVWGLYYRVVKKEGR